MTLAAGSGAGGRASPRALVAWCVFDAGITATVMVIYTFVFGVYVTGAVAADKVAGTAAWAWGQAVAGLAMALLSPLLGAVADRTGRRKPWILVFTLATAAADISLWWVRPEPDWLTFALWASGLGAVARALAYLFYCAMLPSLVPPARVGRLSGWGFAVGYGGGVACLLVALLVLVQAESPLFGLLTRVDQAHVRAVGPLVGLWVLLTALPLFFFTPDQPTTGIPLGRAVREGVAALAGTVRCFRGQRHLVVFLAAAAVYRTGVGTLAAFGGIFASGTFGMGFTEVALFGIGLQVALGLGAWAFAPLDDRFGPRRCIVAALTGIVGCAGALVVVSDRTLFWGLGLALGFFIGPAMACGRSMLVRLAPAEAMAEMFGFYTFSGRLVAFLGPLALGLASAFFVSQRAGMATIVAFFALGLALMLAVGEEPAPCAEGGGEGGGEGEG